MLFPPDLPTDTTDATRGAQEKRHAVRWVKVGYWLIFVGLSFVRVGYEMADESDNRPGNA